MTIKEFMDLCHGIALQKGWWKKDESGELAPRSFREMIALAHSEISEALEIARDPKRQISDLWKEEGTGKPEGFMIELCDLLIRLGDLCRATKIPLDVFMVDEHMNELGFDDLETCSGLMEEFGLAKDNPAEWLDLLHDCVTDGKRSFLDGDMAVGCVDFKEAFQLVGQIWSTVKLVAVPDSVGRLLVSNDLSKWSLEGMILWKCSYNATREFRHGGKRC